MKLLTDWNYNVVVRKEIHFGSPSFDCIVVDVVASNSPFGESFIEESIMKVYTLCKLRARLFKAILMIPKVECYEIVIQELSFIKSLDVSGIDCSLFLAVFWECQ